MRIEPAVTPEQFAVARELFKEYASSLGFNLCFQGFEQEMVGIETAPPTQCFTGRHPYTSFILTEPPVVRSTGPLDRSMSARTNID